MANPLYTYRYIMSTPRASSLPVFNDVESKYSLCLTNELRVLQVHDAGNSLETLLWVVTVQNAKVGRLSVLLASDDIGWVT